MLLGLVWVIFQNSSKSIYVGAHICSPSTEAETLLVKSQLGPCTEIQASQVYVLRMNKTEQIKDFQTIIIGQF